MSTKIEWTEKTWNPFVGCSKISRGCKHCYAILVAARNMSPQHKGLTVLGRAGSNWTGDVRFVPEVLDTPFSWGKPVMVFADSMSDMFHESLVDCEEGRWQIAAVFGVMAATPHTYQVLTKRPDKAAEWFAWVEKAARDAGCSVARYCATMALGRMPARKPTRRPSKVHRALTAVVEAPPAWPLANVWLGCSVENQAAAEQRRDVFLSLPAAVRFVSAEPLVGPLDLSRWLTYDECGGVHWVIGGGESGPGAEPMHPTWIRTLRDQCARYGIAFLFKQWGQYSPVMQESWIAKGEAGRPHTWVALDGEHGDCWLASTDPDSHWLNYTGNPPAGAEAVGRGLIVMASVGKGKAGRQLDGRTYDGYPASGTTRSP